jgi:hypothetical protein
MERSFLKRNTSKAVIAACALLVGSGFLQSCKDDSLTGQPSWLGNSIYERLQDEGNYKTTLQLIDDLNYTDVLKQTGSKTLFVADDDAYNEFFKNNSWKVSKYADLSTAQKKLLLNNSMVNNAYLVELLSNVSGDPPLEGRCMRRETATSIYDSIARMYPDEMPNTKYWAKYKDHKNGIVIVKDNTAAPMIHFLPKYMKTNEITDNDLSILTNGVSNSISDAWVNGKKIIERDITCKNGYIHKVEGVITASDNMASIIRKHADMSGWSKLIDRYTAPYYNETLTKEYDRLNNSTDSVFVLKYFATRSQGSGTASDVTNYKDGDNNNVDAYLPYDPGWNQYSVKNTAGLTLNYDCGAMLVPTNTALNTWWNNDGKALQDEYGTWDRVPDAVLSKLLNVNMLPEFSTTVPSKFTNIVNDAKVEMGVKSTDIDSCFMGCNGVVYLTNKVFSPAAYASVSFPALIHTETMNIIYWAIDNLGFDAYLNSMDSYYSFIIPTNTAMMRYVDPCSFGSTKTVMYQFFYDNDKKTVGAHRFLYDLATNDTTSSATKLTDASSTIVKDRMTDLLNNLIIVGNIEDGNTFYKTKGGGVIKVENAGAEGSMKIYGGLQIEQNTPLTVSTIYDQTKTGNGKAYVVNDAPPLTGKKSVYATLSEDTCYSEFLDLLKGGDPDSAEYNLTQNLVDKKYACVDYNIRLFDTYNYTVWVPTNASIRALHASGALPNWEDFEKQTPELYDGDKSLCDSAKYVIKTKILNFLRYHIQDNSVYIGGGKINGTQYETSKLNPATQRFFKITVNSDNSSMSVEDNVGDVRKVLTDGGHYNKMCREYQYDTTDKESAYNSPLYTSSYAVVHLIDGPLFYDKSQMPSTNKAKRRR